VGRPPAALKLAQVAETAPLWHRFARHSPASGGEKNQSKRVTTASRVISWFL
jgi:hypothetical protein